MTPRKPETIARDVMGGIFHEVQDLCQPGNDGRVAAWQLAERKLHAAAHACHEVAKAIEQRPAAPASNLHPLFAELTEGFRVGV